MEPSNTERAEHRYAGINGWTAHELVTAAVAVQQGALAAVSSAAGSLAGSIEILATILQAGGRMAYAGAGSSGLIAQLDAIELPGTFGLDPDRVPVILAGGAEALKVIPSQAEDDVEAGIAAVDRLALGKGDALVAIAASGRTPFTVATLRRARERGAVTVGLANVAGSPLLEAAHHPVLLETPPEILAGSTRMGAGTAQKCALNILSTGIALKLGHIHAGLMVNMRPENAKLKRRATEIVAAATNADVDQAEDALVAADWSIKTAIVIRLANTDPDTARKRLASSGGRIQAALAQD